MVKKIVIVILFCSASIHSQIAINEGNIIYYSDTILLDYFNYSYMNYYQFNVLKKEKKKIATIKRRPKNAQKMKKIEYLNLGLYFLSDENCKKQIHFYAFGVKFNPDSDKYKGSYYTGTVTILGQQINSKTVFEDIYDSDLLSEFVDRSIYSNPNKAGGSININLSKTSVSISFDINTNLIEDLSFYVR